MRPLRFEPYHLLDGPNVIVDGSPTRGTVLTLTHWPNIESPVALADDLSAQMAFHFLHADESVDADAVSNNHVDQDGLVGVFALTDPEAALAREEFLTDVAAAGDFATYQSRQAARVSMIIAAFTDTDRSPLADTVPSDDDDRCGFLYTELVGRLPELCDHPERWRTLWAEEDERLSTHEADLESGRITIDEVPDLDLAIVTAVDDERLGGGHRFGGRWADGLHPMAIHNATTCLATLQVVGRRYLFTYRYESWVQLRSRRPRPRVDLGPLAAELSELEAGSAHWLFDGVADLTPSLHLVGADESAVAPADFRGRLESFLRSAPPAWNPYSRS